MRVLSSERFEQAIRSVERGIDRGRLTVRYGCGSPLTLRAELAGFQNDDGGYGNRIEPDFWLPGSSPMATTIGLQYLAAAGAGIIAKITRKPSIFNLQKVAEFKQKSWTCTSKKSAEVLGFVPEHTLEEGFRKTIEWYRAKGFLQA